MADLVPFTFNELLARHRLAAGLSQQDVAYALRDRDLGVTAMTVSNWEAGKNPPRSSAIVYALEEILDCAPELSEALGLAPGGGQGRLDALEERLRGLEDQLGSLQRELRDALSEIRGGR